MAASETISPPILAKRLPGLDRHEACSSIATMSPVSCQPSLGGSSTPDFGPKIAEHDIRSAHEKSAAALDSRDWLERLSTPGISRPTVPNLLNIGVFSASTARSP